MDDAEKSDRCSMHEKKKNFSECNVDHPLFEWKLWTKIPALGGNFAFIVKVKGGWILTL